MSGSDEAKFDIGRQNSIISGETAICIIGGESKCLSVPINRRKDDDREDMVFELGCAPRVDAKSSNPVSVRGESD